MTPVSAWIHAVKKVDAALHAFQNICGGSYAHQVSRLVLWQIGNRLLQNIIHLFVRLSDRQPANCIAVQIHLGDPLCMIYPNICIDRALINTK